MRRHDAPLLPAPWPAPIDWSCRSRTTIAIPVPRDVIATGMETVAEFGSEADAARAVACVNACAGMDDPAQVIADARRYLRTYVEMCDILKRPDAAAVAKLTLQAMGGTP